MTRAISGVGAGAGAHILSSTESALIGLPTLNQWYAKAQRLLDHGEASRKDIWQPRGAETFLRDMPEHAAPYYTTPMAALTALGMENGFENRLPDAPSIAEEERVAFAPVFLGRQRSQALVVRPKTYYLEPGIRFAVTPLVKVGDASFDVLGKKKVDRAGLPLLGVGPAEDTREELIAPMIVWLWDQRESQLRFKDQMAVARFSTDTEYRPRNLDTPLTVINRWLRSAGQT